MELFTICKATALFTTLFTSLKKQKEGNKDWGIGVGLPKIIQQSHSNMYNYI